ncbi:hypothetical protein [Azospirillum thiophilum]|nr:hypothetical protein [Azospirillum thiophilum]
MNVTAVLVPSQKMLENAQGYIADLEASDAEVLAGRTGHYWVNLAGPLLAHTRTIARAYAGMPAGMAALAALADPSDAAWIRALLLDPDRRQRLLADMAHVHPAGSGPLSDALIYWRRTVPQMSSETLRGAVAVAVALIDRPVPAPVPEIYPTLA